MPIAWVDVPDPKNPPAGAPKLNAANLNQLAVTADAGTAGTPTGDAVKAAIDARTVLPVAGSYTYNADGTVASGPAGETYAYNTDGTVHSVTLNGVTRTYSYDANLNVTGVA